jgi:homoserine kinase type II
MAVYTNIGAERMAQIVTAFDVGALVSAKGIAEGVSNSNWLIETEGNGGGPTRFILTMYESRVDTDDLPFFLNLLDHLAEHGCPVPRTIHDRDNRPFHFCDGKALALIEFLPGVSVSEPTPAQARAVGAALAQVHLAGTSYGAERANGMDLPAWQRLIGGCGEDGLASIHPELGRIVADELRFLESNWPAGLSRGVIHADLFPDNVLMRGNEVAGLIDFYFACNDITAYDVAVTHAAWCFSGDGARFDPALSSALLQGYETVRPIAPEERAALPILARGAAIRFLATRAYDWLHTPQDALVTRKDPLAFARRLAFYADPGNAGVFENGLGD